MENSRNNGIKYDTDKQMWDLLDKDFMSILEEVIKVLTLGTKKYSKDNWKNIEDINNRYFAANMRHIKDWRKDKISDEESNLHNLTHSIVNCMFLIWDDVNKGKYSFKNE